MKKNAYRERITKEDVLCALAMFGVAAGLLAFRYGVVLWPYLH